MAKHPQTPQESLQLILDPTTFKEFLRDLLFREAGKPYFKSLHIPRQRWRRLLGAWRTLPTYQAERQLLPVGGRNSDQRIREFFATHLHLRTEFQEGGMPVTAIYVLQQRCPPRNAALAYVHWLECTLHDQIGYCVQLAGGPTPPPRPPQGTSTEAC